VAFQNPASFQESSAYRDASVAAAQSAFMARVYRWMFIGLAVTGAVAWYTANSPAVLQVVLPMMVPLLIGEVLLVLALSWLATRVSGAVAALLFLIYAAVNGLTFSVIFLVYQLGSIGEVFVLTGAVFGAMSLYATVTRKDLSGWGAFLFMGLVGVIVAGIVNLFIRSDMMSFVLACASVVIFAGLTAYDTQKLRRFHASAGYSAAASLSIVGALMLYLDFVNLFLALLRLFGRRR
jgi:FtsH-binding integral membrane protein